MKIINEHAFEADNGMMLTNGETFVTEVYLGANDSIDNWHEVTEEEAERLHNTEAPTELTAEQKAQAYDILMGVTE